MAEHPNVVAVREMIEAFNAMDVERITAGMAPDVKWHMIGGRTVEGLEALASEMTATSAGISFTSDLHDVVGNDEHVVALVNTTVSAGGQEFSYRTAEIMHVTDAVITERWAFSDDTEAINEFFGQLS